MSYTWVVKPIPNHGPDKKNTLDVKSQQASARKNEEKQCVDKNTGRKEKSHKIETKVKARSKWAQGVKKHKNNSQGQPDAKQLL